MELLITGASGFLGARLARTLLAEGTLALAGRDPAPITTLHLTDLSPPPADLAADPRVRATVGDLGELLALGRLPLAAVDAVVHLAAAVSADCEADLDLGLRSNLQAGLALLQALRHAGRGPVLVFASSVAVFGAPAGQTLPAVIDDAVAPQPQGSYGVQKLVLEHLVADFSRRGLIDGRSVRLMTVAVRPGRPNGAASGFLSGMVREPLAGQRCCVPVAPDLRVALASPRRTIDGLLCALRTAPAAWGPRSAVNLPALSTTVGAIADALARLAGPDVAARLDWQPDPRIGAIVGGWPGRFDAARAAALGLQPDPDVDALITEFAHAHPDALARPLEAAR